MNILSFFQEGLFKSNHIIWLLLCFAIVISFILINKKYKFSLETNVTILVCVCIINEACKLCVNLIDTGVTTGLSAGGYYDPRHLPLQLCSLQMFLFFALKFFVKKEETKEKILGFMVPSLMIGASISLFIPTDGTTFADIYVWRYFLYHAAIIAFGVYLVVFKQVKITGKVYLRNVVYLFIYFVICLWINGILNYANTNFLFTRRPPMDGLPLLNLDHGYRVYLITLVSIALIVLALVHLPFIIVNRVKDKKLTKCE